MLPVVRGIAETSRQIGLYTILLVALTVVFAVVANMGVIYAVAAAVMGVLFLWRAYVLWRQGTSPEASTAQAIRLYRYSITYLAVLFAAVALTSTRSARLGLEIAFLGGASTVTGSRFLLTTEPRPRPDRLRHVPGQPERDDPQPGPARVRPAEIDAILVTHAHLDHCGLLPVAVKRRVRGPIYLTTATAELVELVLLDSGRLQEEFAKRHSRWERRHADEAGADDEKAAGEVPGRRRGGATGRRGGPRPDVRRAGRGRGRHHGVHRRGRGDGDARTTPGGPDPEAALRGQPPELLIDLDAPLYDEEDAEARHAPVQDRSLRRGGPRSRPASSRRSSMRGTSSARRSSRSWSGRPTAATRRRSSSRATSAGRTRRSCATRRR